MIREAMTNEYELLEDRYMYGKTSMTMGRERGYDESTVRWHISVAHEKITKFLEQRGELNVIS